MFTEISQHARQAPSPWYSHRCSTGQTESNSDNTSSSARKFYEEKQSWIRDEKFILDKADQGKSPGDGNILLRRE